MLLLKKRQYKKNCKSILFRRHLNRGSKAGNSLGDIEVTTKFLPINPIPMANYNFWKRRKNTHKKRATAHNAGLTAVRAEVLWLDENRRLGILI